MSTSPVVSSSPFPIGPTTSLLSLSDELLLTIIQNLDRHTDVPSTRLACRKLNALTETYFFRNVMITLSEEVFQPQWQLKLRLAPPQTSKTKQFSVLNQRRSPTSYYYTGVICHPNSYRILRWNLLDSIAESANQEFSKAACINGMQFYPKLAKFEERQLTVFRWRHAIPLSLANLAPIIERQAWSLQELEISMIQPPVANALRKFRAIVKDKKFPNLRSFKYHGLSHTEPLPVNRPERGGRSRMLRPMFQEFHSTLQELVLSQDHCISQVGKTPMTLGRTYYDTLCRLDDLYIDSSKTMTTLDEQPPITLNLSTLELGGFAVGDLFDVPTDPTIAPRVRVHLPAVRRLVLNDCYRLSDLLHKLHARKGEIQLTHFAVRINEDDEDGFGPGNGVYEALRDFLLCFQGLKVLSVLVDGLADGMRVGKDVLIHHAKTLRAYSVATRSCDDGRGGHDEQITLRFVSIPNHGIAVKDSITPGCLAAPPALREYGTFLSKIVGNEYTNLRYLSQFPDLRTVVIRNFPPLSSGLKVLGKNIKSQQYWRDRSGYVDTANIYKVVETMAEQIALPFYALPDSYNVPDPLPMEEDDLPFPDGYIDDHDVDPAEEEERIRSDLEQIAAGHTAIRDKLLGFSLRSPSSSPTPKKDPSRDIMKQKAEVDPGFRDVMWRVDQGEASLYEKDAFESYQATVQATLGVKAPRDGTKPKLSLLVVGDWTYRDQMNISGPRQWDPTAWSYSRSSVNDSSYDDRSDRSIDDYDTWNDNTYQLRHGFKKQFDVSLLPVFFTIDWSVVYDKKKARHRWCPKATLLEQDTLEGQGALSNIELLDFAWRI